MRRLKLFILIPVMTALFGACQERESAIDPVPSEACIRAVVPAPVPDLALETKGAAVNADNTAVQFNWIQGIDAISIYASEANEMMTYAVKEVVENNPLACVFTVEDFKLKSGNVYYGVYPNGASLDPKSVPFSYEGQRQAALNDDSHLPAYSFMMTPEMTATETGGDLEFSQLSSWIIFDIQSLTDFTADRIVLTTSTPNAFLVDGSIDLLTGEITNGNTTGTIQLPLGIDGEGVEIEAGKSSYAYLAVNNIAVLDDITAMVSGTKDGEPFYFQKHTEFENGRQFLPNKYLTIHIIEPVVAEVNGRSYGSLADAVAAVPANGIKTTVTMRSNVEEETNEPLFTVESGQNMVIDLNGCHIAQYVAEGTSSALVVNHGTLTITDSNYSENSGIGSFVSPDPENENENYVIDNYGTLTLERGNIMLIPENSSCGMTAAIHAREGSTTNIEGGYINSSACMAILQESRAEAQNNVTISGGSLECECNQGTVVVCQMHQNQHSSLTIKGDAVISNDNDEWPAVNIVNTNYDLYDLKNVRLDISGGEFCGDVRISYPMPEDNLSISGGCFKGYFGVNCQDPGLRFITGGYFYRKSYWRWYIAPGYSYTYSEDKNAYMVVECNDNETGSTVGLGDWK